MEALIHNSESEIQNTVQSLISLYFICILSGK